MKRVPLLVAGITGLLVGVALVLPAVALGRSGGPDSALSAGPLALGLLLMAVAAGSLRAGWGRRSA